MIWSKIWPKMPQKAKTKPHYSSFRLFKIPKKFETVLGMLNFFSVVSHGAAIITTTIKHNTNKNSSENN